MRGHREVHGISLSEMFWWEAEAFIRVTRVGTSEEIKTVYTGRRALSVLQFFSQFIPVSYTHLDVYKRQILYRPYIPSHARYL